MAREIHLGSLLREVDAVAPVMTGVGQSACRALIVLGTVKLDSTHIHSEPDDLRGSRKSPQRCFRRGLM
jgi:hypothetical protein